MFEYSGGRREKGVNDVFPGRDWEISLITERWNILTFEITAEEGEIQREGETDAKSGFKMQMWVTVSAG